MWTGVRKSLRAYGHHTVREEDGAGEGAALVVASVAEGAEEVGLE